MKKLINLTRHNVTLKQLGHTRLFPKSGQVARIAESSSYVVRDGLLLKEIGNQRLLGLPLHSAEDEVLIVSRVVAEHARKFGDHSNLVFPDDLIVEEGHIVGCRALGVLL